MTFSLSRCSSKTKKPVVVKPKHHAKKAKPERKRQTVRAKLPIPSFKPDMELGRLEAEFLEGSNVQVETKPPRMPIPTFRSSLGGPANYSSDSDGTFEDILFTRRIPKTLPVKPGKQMVSKEAELRPRKASTVAQLPSATHPPETAATGTAEPHGTHQKDAESGVAIPKTSDDGSGLEEDGIPEKAATKSNPSKNGEGIRARSNLLPDKASTRPQTPEPASPTDIRQSVRPTGKENTEANAGSNGEIKCPAKSTTTAKRQEHAAQPRSDPVSVAGTDQGDKPAPATKEGGKGDSPRDHPNASKSGPGDVGNVGGSTEMNASQSHQARPQSVEQTLPPDTEQVSLPTAKQNTPEIANSSVEREHAVAAPVAVQCQEIASPEVNPDVVPTKAPPKEVRGRGRPRGRPKAVKPVGSDGGRANLASQAITAAPKGRKRARKGSCALCTTCPCQNRHDSGVTSALDVKTFARSDAAVEKALIRRLQKLEKSSEQYECLTEEVRRKLKKHRRTMWKSKEQKLPNKKQGWFLPDAQEWEASATMNIEVLPHNEVQDAVDATFPNAPTVQATLTQLLGGSKKKKETDAQAAKGTGLATIEEGEESSSESAGVYPMEDDLPLEYVAELPQSDAIRRIEWKQNHTNGKSSSSSSNSFWGAVLGKGDHNRRTGNTSECKSSFQCSWDQLFASCNTDDDENGIDHLLGLFEQEKQLTQTEEVTGSEDWIKTTMSQLSPGRRDKAREIVSTIESDQDKLGKLEEACPEWKENVAFALKQGKDEIAGALDEIASRRRRMKEAKLFLLRAYEKQQVALETFESMLTSSLDCLEERATTDKPEVEGGFLTAMSQEQKPVTENHDNPLEPHKGLLPECEDSSHNCRDVVLSY